MGVGFGTCALVFFCSLLDISGPWFSHLNKDQKHQLQKLLWGHLWEDTSRMLGTGKGSIPSPSLPHLLAAGSRQPSLQVAESRTSSRSSHAPWGRGGPPDSLASVQRPQVQSLLTQTGPNGDL